MMVEHYHTAVPDFVCTIKFMGYTDTDSMR